MKEKQSEFPVEGNILVNGTRVPFRCYITLEIEKLKDLRNEKVKDSCEEGKEFFEKREEFSEKKGEKEANMRCHTEGRTLLGVYEQFLDDYRMRYESGLRAKSTYEKYKLVYRYLKEFIRWRYRMGDVALCDLKPQFIEDFDLFLRTIHHCCNNTVYIYIAPLRTMVRIAIRNDWLHHNPFGDYVIHKEDTERGFLTRKEIKKLMEGTLKNEKQELYRDLFLFCVFTGLSYADLRNLSEENIRKYFDSHLWISIHRQKTGVQSNIRLLTIPLQILKKYRGKCSNRRIFPVPPYMSCLHGIRSVAKRCGIDRHITWHQSRHTMATEICLNNGVPIETVSSILGHKNVRTTQIYAKVTKEKMNRDMNRLSNALRI